FAALFKRRAKAPQAAGYAAQQAGGGGQQAMMFAPQAAPGDVQLAGHQHATPNPVCDPSGPNSMGAGPHSMGTGTFPYGSQYDAGHPGIPFDGGRYGYYGGAH